MEEVKVEMHSMVELIIARLKSHPEEFQKWKNLADGNKNYMTKKEGVALHQAFREASMGEAHRHMMRAILNADEPKKEDPTMKTLLPGLQKYFADRAKNGFTASDTSYIQSLKNKGLL